MVSISTKIYPTEDKKKILSALQKTFPGADFKTTKNQISCECGLDNLSELKRKIEDKKIKNTVRYLLIQNGFLQLNKQTMVIGKINFVEEGYALGNIEIRTGEIDKLLAYLVPT